MIIQPTPEMIAFFECRTNKHIARVGKCLHMLADESDYGDELIHRATIHDASKFEEAERIAYIWLTEFHRCRQVNQPFTYPDGIEEMVKKAIEHHLAHNRHHAEFHANPNDMSNVDIIEMVCDWTAMAQELDQNDGSASQWADKTIGHQIQFNDDRKNLIYSTIEQLDCAIKRYTSRI